MTIVERIARAIRRALREPDHVDFKVIADNSQDLIIRCGRDRIADYVSPSIVDMLGITPEEVIGRSHLSYVVPEDLPILHEVMERHLAGEINTRAAFRMRRNDGSTVWVEGRGRMVGSPANDDVRFVVVMRDISIHKGRKEKLESLAQTDGLTSIANRRAFDERLAAEWVRARDTGACLSMLLLDIDHFKLFNDHYGHLPGDECLRATAHCLSETVTHPGAMVARYGGEEIAIILPGAGPRAASAIGQALRTAIERLGIPHERSDAAQTVTVSIGAATALPEAFQANAAPECLIQAADEALYAAKRAGRNRLKSKSLPETASARPVRLVFAA